MNCLFFAKRSHPMYKTLLLVLSVYLSSTNAFLFAATESQEVARTETVYLLIHGLASSAETWSDLIKKNPSINNNCPKASLGGPVEYSLCYRYEFSDKKVNGVEWENGDGGTFQELGDEIGLAVANIENLVHPKSIILVGHSRGGLAARAYVQSLTAETPYRLALFTIGTPHQGSPFGRVQHWLTDKGYAPDDVIYFLLPDRFADGDRANNDSAASRGLLDRIAEKVLLRFGDAELVKGALDIVRHIFPGFFAFLGRLDVVIDIIQVKLFELRSPIGHGAL